MRLPVFISRKEYERLLRQDRVVSTTVLVFDWFSGWKDLRIIREYIFAESYVGGIEEARKKYANERGTDVYGNPTWQ